MDTATDTATDTVMDTVMDMDMDMPQMDGSEMGMAHDEIDQAIDQVSEPDPFQMPYDPSMMPEYMLDPEMQYMIPGTMPMGPMHGPAPGF